jgi:hypothetical protein
VALGSFAGFSSGFSVRVPWLTAYGEAKIQFRRSSQSRPDEVRAQVGRAKTQLQGYGKNVLLYVG